MLLHDIFVPIDAHLGSDVGKAMEICNSAQRLKIRRR